MAASIRSSIVTRVYISFILIGLVGATICFKMFYIQFTDQEKWIDMYEQQSTKYVDVEPLRGDIYAADGKILVTSLPEYDIRMDFKTDGLTLEYFNEHIDSLCIQLNQLFRDKSVEEYKRVIVKARRDGNRYFLLKRDINYQEYQKLKTFHILNRGRYKGGMMVIQKNKRVKTYKHLASRTIGYKIGDVQPVGIEGAFDNYLGGQKGQRLVQRIAGGYWMPVSDEDEIKSKDGFDIVTTLDVQLQDVAQNALLKQLSKHNAHHGCVVLMETQTGHIKAIANLTRNSDGSYSENYNYAIGESTEPGSTFKLVSYLAALEDNNLDLEDSVNTQGGEITFADRTLKDSKEGGYGVITYRNAFELSSNVAVSKLIHTHYKSNPEKFIEHAKALGLNNPLGMQIPGEGKPRIKSSSDKDWSKVSLPYMSIGYECKLTPLQILALYNAVANDGKLIQPLLVSEVSSMGKSIEDFEPVVLNPKICSSDNLKKLRSLLEGVVERGTATNLNTAEYKIAGKTGTAQIASGSKGYKSGKTNYQASFCGYFPAENPQYSMIVVINDPNSYAYYGNVVAGPIFREIADKVYSTYLKRFKDITKDLKYYTEDIPVSKGGKSEEISKIYERLGISVDYTFDDEWVKARANEKSVQLQSIPVSPQLIPNVVGMNISDAVYLLESAGLNVRFRGAGKIVKQSLNPGQQIIKGNTIYLLLA
jgi:cell division protein FtsI (penicillin-binding protein 3)